MQRQAHLLGREIPQRDLQRLMERQAEGPLLPPRGRGTRWTSASGGWPSSSGQTSSRKTRSISASVGQRVKQGLDKAQPDLAGIGNELERRYIDRVGAHLAVADGPVAAELETGDAKL